jgi:hypothetical protein
MHIYEKSKILFNRTLQYIRLKKYSLCFLIVIVGIIINYLLSPSPPLFTGFEPHFELDRDTSMEHFSYLNKGLGANKFSSVFNDGLLVDLKNVGNCMLKYDSAALYNKISIPKTLSKKQNGVAKKQEWQLNSLGHNETQKISVPQSLCVVKAWNIDVENFPLPFNEMKVIVLNAQSINFFNGTFKNKLLSCTAQDSVYFSDCDVRNVKLSEIYAPKIIFEDSKLTNITLNTLYKEIVLDNIQLDSTNYLFINSKVYFGRLTGNGTLELRLNSLSKHKGLIPITATELDFNRLKVPDYGIRFFPDASLNFEDKVRFLNQLIRHYEEIESEKSLYDIALQKMTYHHKGDSITPIIKEKWNNFGYDKDLILKNSLFLFLLFFSVNLLLFPRIVHNGYAIEELEKADLAIRTKYIDNHFFIGFFNCLHCLIFTFFIFWGLKLSVESLRISKIGYSFYILIQYLVGIICLAYIANIIITK